MRAINNTVPEVIARDARNRHRAEFVAANPGIPEEVLVVVYFRRATGGKWWYAPSGKIDLSGERPRWVESAPLEAKWYEIPVCPEKIKRISQRTLGKYAKELRSADIYFFYEEE